MSPSADFWRGRRVLITGHTGFKGSWLWLVLRRLGADVHGLALAPATEPSLSALCGIPASNQSTLCDIRDAGRTLACVRAARPEIVMHLAAQPIVRLSYAAPAETYATNVMGTVNVLEAVRASPGVRAVVVVTSDKCYRNREWAWAYREDDALGGHDPYSSSKACAELVAESWRSAYFAAQGVALATARAGNVIGGGDWSPDRLIADCVRAFARHEPIRLRNPRAVRPWQHVLESIWGYLLLAERLVVEPAAAAEAWNFGPFESSVRSVEDVVAAFAAAWGRDASWLADPGPHPHEAGTLLVDGAKARSRLGWRPRLAVDEAVAWTADWYRRSYAGEPAAALCEAQIERYETMARGSGHAPASATAPRLMS